MANDLMSRWLWVRRQLAADPKKTALLGVLTLVMVGVYGRMLLSKPSESVAEVILAPELLSATSPTALQAQGLLPPPTATVDVPVGGRQIVNVAGTSREAARELMGADWDLFGGHEPAEPAAAGPAPPGILRNAIDALRRRTADRRAIIEKVRTEGAGLSLQSTIIGDDPLAVINGRIVRPGQKVAGFVLEAVEARRVHLSKHGVRYTVAMP